MRFSRHTPTPAPALPHTLRAVARWASLLGLALTSSCQSAATDKPVIGMVQVSSIAPLDDAREGYLKALSDSGFVRDQNITIIERNAQGDIATLTLIMNEFKRQGVTHVAPISSVATQTAMKVFTDRPIVFGAVANPYAINAGTSPTAHRPNVTGASIPLPADSALALAHHAFPQVPTWGTLFDPADPFAEFYLDMVKRAAAAMSIKLVSVACTSPQDIGTAVQALRSQGAGGIMQIPSIMIGGGFSALVKSARELRMPVVAANTGYAGSTLALGLSFYDNGYQAGLQLIRVLRGENPADIPFKASAKDVLVIDLQAAADFGVTIPDDVLKRATKIVPLNGTTGAADSSRAPAAASSSASTAAATASSSAVAFWLSALVLGLAFAALGWGVFVSSRVLRFADITPDGSFPLGAAVAATLIVNGVNPLLATLIAMIAGMGAGYVTGLLHTRLSVTELLCGILSMTALYSVNLHVMGRSNVSLLDKPTLATQLHTLVPATASWGNDATFGVVCLVLMGALGTVLALFLRTDFGMAMRAVGDNAAMIIAQGVDRRIMIELGLALANGLVAVSGALIAQYQGFADVGMGVGTLVAGMASVILGETLRYKRWRLGATVVMVAVGAMLFRTLIALALRIGLDPIDLKLATAAFVLLTLVMPKLRSRLRTGGAAR